MSESETLDNNITVNVVITCSGVVCPYKDKCVSYPTRCNTCKHNSAKRDYYEPEPCPYYPYPYNPWYPYTNPYQPWITWWTNCDWDSNYTNTNEDYYCSYGIGIGGQLE